MVYHILFFFFLKKYVTLNLSRRFVIVGLGFKNDVLKEEGNRLFSYELLVLFIVWRIMTGSGKGKQQARVRTSVLLWVDARLY